MLSRHSSQGINRYVPTDTHAEFGSDGNSFASAREREREKDCVHLGGEGCASPCVCVCATVAHEPERLQKASVSHTAVVISQQGSW